MQRLTLITWDVFYYQSGNEGIPMKLFDEANTVQNKQVKANKAAEKKFRLAYGSLALNVVMRSFIKI